MRESHVVCVCAGDESQWRREIIRRISALRTISQEFCTTWEWLVIDGKEGAQLPDFYTENAEFYDRGKDTSG